MATETAPFPTNDAEDEASSAHTKSSEDVTAGEVSGERLIDLKAEIAKPEVAKGMRNHLEGLLRESKPYEAAMYLTEMHRAGIRLKKDGVNHQRVKESLMETLQSEIAQRDRESMTNADDSELAWMNTAKLAARMKIVGMLDPETELSQDVRDKMKAEFEYSLEHPSDQQDLTSYAMYLRTLRVKQTLTEGEKNRLVDQVDHKLAQPDATFVQASLQRGRLRSLKCETGFTDEERMKYTDGSFWDGLTQEERLRHRYILDKFHSPETARFELSHEERTILQELPGQLQQHESFRSYPQAVGDIRAFERATAGKEITADEDVIVLRHPDGTEIGTIRKDEVLDLELTDDDYKDFGGEPSIEEPELNATEPALGEQVRPDEVQTPATMTSTFGGEVIESADAESTSYAGEYPEQNPELTSTEEEHGAQPKATPMDTVGSAVASDPAETQSPEDVTTTWVGEADTEDVDESPTGKVNATARTTETRSDAIADLMVLHGFGQYIEGLVDELSQKGKDIDTKSVNARLNAAARMRLRNQASPGDIREGLLWVVENETGIQLEETRKMLDSQKQQDAKSQRSRNDRNSEQEHTAASKKKKQKNNKQRTSNEGKRAKRQRTGGEELHDLLSNVTEDEIRERRVARDEYETPEPRQLNREQMKPVALPSKDEQEIDLLAPTQATEPGEKVMESQVTTPEPKRTGDFISELMEISDAASPGDVEDLSQEVLEGDLEALLGKLSRKQKQKIRERLIALKEHHGIEVAEKDSSTGRSVSLLDRLREAERRLNKQ